MIHGALETLPARDRAIAAGETVYAIGRLDAIRRIERQAGDGQAPTADATAEAQPAED